MIIITISMTLLDLKSNREDNMMKYQYKIDK